MNFPVYVVKASFTWDKTVENATQIMEDKTKALDLHNRWAVENKMSTVAIFKAENLEELNSILYVTFN